MANPFVLKEKRCHRVYSTAENGEDVELGVAEVRASSKSFEEI